MFKKDSELKAVAIIAQRRDNLQKHWKFELKLARAKKRDSSQVFAEMEVELAKAVQKQDLNEAKWAAEIRTITRNEIKEATARIKLATEKLAAYTS